MMRNRSDHVVQAAMAAGAAAAAACWLLLAAQTVLSVQWRMEHDTPLLHYVAYLVDEAGFVPYRDVFETSMPGALLCHLLIGKTLGYGDAAFRAVDIVFVVLVSFCSWGILRRLGRWPAAVGGPLFGLVYLMAGPAMSLQRDVLAVLPISAAVLVAVAARDRARGSPAAPAAGIGALFALAAAIKPQLGIGLPAVMWYLSPPRSGRMAARPLREWLFASGGFALAFAAPLAWLAATGGLPAFLRIFREYLPLHLGLSGEHDVIAGLGGRLSYMAESFLGFGGLRRLLPGAAVGAALALTGRADGEGKRLVRLLVILAGLHALCPVLAGQFWNYHWMPFAWTACLLTALLAVPLGRATGTRPRFRAVTGVLLLLAVLGAAIRPAPDFRRQIRGLQPHPPKNGRVDAIAGFLAANLRPGETVQPRDWAGGAVHAMLIARALPATPYLYDYVFHHHVSHPYVREARRRFMQRLREAPPRFVIEIPERPRPTGPDTAADFPAYDSFLAERYRRVDAGLECVILELDPVDGD